MLLPNSRFVTDELDSLLLVVVLVTSRYVETPGICQMQGHLGRILTLEVLLSRPSCISGVLRLVSDIRESPRCQSPPILKRRPTFATLVLTHAVRLHIRSSVINHLHRRHCNRGATMVSRGVHVPCVHFDSPRPSSDTLSPHLRAHNWELLHLRQVRRA